MSIPINFSYSNSLSASKQPLVTQKDAMFPNSNSVIANWSKPLVTGDADFPPILPGKAGPLKHWRKRLTPRTGSANGRAGVSLDAINSPGGSVLVGSSSCHCIKSDDNEINNSYIITNNKFLQSTSQTIKPKSNAYDHNGSCCNPAKINVIKSGIVSNNKNYYATSTQYLKARGLTYNQKLSIRRIEGNGQTEGNKYFNDKCQPIPPSDSKYGSQSFYINTPVGTDIRGPNNTLCSNIRTVYKPNNTQFATQGAVESGTRIMKLKNSILRPHKSKCHPPTNQQTN